MAQLTARRVHPPLPPLHLQQLHIQQPSLGHERPQQSLPLFQRLGLPDPLRHLRGAELPWAFRTTLATLAPSSVNSTYPN